MATEQDYWNQMYANACDQNEVLSLRQQLAELKGMREEVVHYQKEFHRTRDQLSDHIKREVMLRNALRHLWNERTPDSYDEAGEALAATADLDGLILCHAEPAAIVYLDYGGNGAVLQTELADDEPLYRAWEPKK